MKVILLRDVAKVGRKNDVVEVPDGYGMNKLVPQGMAKPATPENLKAIKSQTASAESAKAQGAEAFAVLVDKLKEAEVTISVEANEEGRLFQAVKADAIATAVEKATGESVHVEQVVLGDPIKNVGEHTITLASGTDSIKQTVNVVAI